MVIVFSAVFFIRDLIINCGMINEVFRVFMSIW